MSKETDAARNRAKRKKQAIRRAGDALTLKGDYGKSGVQAAVKKNRTAPKKIVKNKDTKEVKRETRTAGYGGSVKQADGPQQSKKGYFGSNTTRLKAEADKGKAKKSAPSRTVAKDKKKPKKDEFSFQKAINKGFGRVY